MKESRKHLKLKARRALLGKYPGAIGIYIFTVVAGMLFFTLIGISTVFLWGLLLPSMSEEVELLVLLGMFSLGMMIYLWFLCLVIPGYFKFYLNICQGRQAGFSDVFWGFGSCGGKFWGIGLVIAVIFGFLIVPEVLLVSVLETTEEVLFPTVFLIGYNLLLTVVGVYVALTYGQFYFLLADHPQMSLYQALGESRRLMKGSRLRLLVLELSFLGWYVIVYITFGLAALWLTPYVLATNVCFYLNLKEIPRE